MSGVSPFNVGKTHEGAYYEGMKVGTGHEWRYPNGLWKEVKLSPEKWAVEYLSRKERLRVAPDGTGAEVGSQYHWLIVGHQYVRKADANTYETRLVGSKFKVGHKRPKWVGWSYDYPNQEAAEDRVKRLLLREAMDPNGVSWMVRTVG